jgi:hypothetical protein
MGTFLASLASALVAAVVSLAVVQLTDKKESRRRSEEYRRQMSKSEYDHYRIIHSASLTAARSYMHALSDFASFAYRRRTGTLGRVIIDEPELVRRLIATDREMAHQESVMNLSQDSDAYNSYLELTRTLRGFRLLLDQGNPATNLPPDDVHPDHPEWKQSYEEYLRARRNFVDSALKHIGSLAEK